MKNRCVCAYNIPIFNHRHIYYQFQKGGVITLYEHFQSCYQDINHQIQSIQERIRQLPEGKLICCNQKSQTKWYQSDGKQKTYIPKSNRMLAEQLAQKKYLSYLLADLENEKRAIDFYLRHHSPTGKSEQLLTEPSEYQNLLSPYFSPQETELSDWINAPYTRNPSHPENLIFNTIAGYAVRSKSELMIDMCLRTHHIPFRYECSLQLNNTTVYPDFTILHPVTRKLFYWEHFGMMDNPAYVDNVCSKIQFYSSHGIIPGIHLLTTYETKEIPLDIRTVDNLIQHYFL